jgi:hypothetical protein
MVQMMEDRNGILVYSYEDLKKLHPENVTKGMWCFQANFHDGHKKCAEAVQGCGWVIGFMFNNRAEEEKGMTGINTFQSFPINDYDLNMLRKYSDVGVVLTGDYQPWKQYWNEILKEFDENFPIECLKENEILDDRDQYNTLLHSVAFRYILHKVYKINFDYQAQGGKDRFRSAGYIDYVYDRWGVKIDLLDSSKDDVGNSISRTITGLPTELKNKIDVQLLYPEFKSINDVRENIKHINGLKVINFYRMNGWVHATFKFDNYKSWTEGIRWK